MAAKHPPGDLSQIVTIPNALSLLRILAIAPYLIVLFGPNDRVIATFVLAAAGITDFADGYLARRLGQVTTLGKMLDPTADRLLLGAAITSMIAYGAIPIWLAATVLGREILVSSTVLILAARGVDRIDVTWLGKAATFGLMVSFPLLLLGHGPGSWAHGVVLTAKIMLVPALALSLISALGYIPIARHGLAERDARIAAPRERSLDETSSH